MMNFLNNWYSGSISRTKYLKVVLTSLLILFIFNSLYLSLVINYFDAPVLGVISLIPFTLPVLILYLGLNVRRARSLLSHSTDKEVYVFVGITFILFFIPMISLLVHGLYLLGPEGIDESANYKKYFKEPIKGFVENC